ncbi:hypothetical protein FIBSPDRAFT_233698 [Athelia psychrophila]|uniref:Uncharacterized protein n=1 Tax=Athelia psychrophila TaxID=1759441 RepID=A0A165YI07_9AGAM|nr:hypothetical protein FIBSPDRAFT_233698 [Fibularhizoctonia sp. CBS 109695]
MSIEFTARQSYVIHTSPNLRLMLFYSNYCYVLDFRRGLYIGVMLEEGGAVAATPKQNLISHGVLVATVGFTTALIWFLSRKVRLVKPEVIYARRKARQGKMHNRIFSAHAGAAKSQNSAVFNPNSSGSNIPLNSTEHQQWDSNGRAIGYAGDPRFVYQPEPRRGRQQVLSYREDSGGYENGTTYPKGLTDGRSPVKQQVLSYWEDWEGYENGNTYPRGLTDGRRPIRQESSESEHGTPPRIDTFDMPRVASPEDDGYDNPFDAPFVPPSGPLPPPFPGAESHFQPPQSYPSYTPYTTSQPSVRDSYLLNPFGDDASPHPYPGHAHEATGDSHLATDGFSRAYR